MKHKLDPEEELGICLVCRLVEGSLTTDCSGKVSSKYGDDTYEGRIDYREDEGGWVNKINPTNQSWLYGTIYDMYQGHERVPKSKSEIILNFGIDKLQYKEVEKQLIRDMYEEG